MYKPLLSQEPLTRPCRPGPQPRRHLIAVNACPPPPAPQSTLSSDTAEGDDSAAFFAASMAPGLTSSGQNTLPAFAALESGMHPHNVEEAAAAAAAVDAASAGRKRSQALEAQTDDAMPPPDPRPRGLQYVAEAATGARRPLANGRSSASQRTSGSEPRDAAEQVVFLDSALFPVPATLASCLAVIIWHVFTWSCRGFCSFLSLISSFLQSAHRFGTVRADSDCRPPARVNVLSNVGCVLLNAGTHGMHPDYRLCNTGYSN
jgi:hypothetical protein